MTILSSFGSGTFRQDAFVMVNLGLKMAMKATKSGSKVSLSVYDPSVEDATLLWNVQNDVPGQVKLLPLFIPNQVLGLGISAGSTPQVTNGIPAVVSAPGSISSTSWSLVPYAPTPYKIVGGWGNSLLTYKTPHKDLSYQDASRHNDENTLVSISPNNDTGNEMVWFRIPAGGQEDTTFYTSFIVINKGTGLAIKGSTKPGDKAIATVFDPFDGAFVWSEDRLQKSKQEFVSINLGVQIFNGLR